MHITWHGGYSVRIVSGDKILVLDPSTRLKADIVALSNPADPTMSALSGVSGEYTVLNSPGEYEIGGFVLHALAWYTPDGVERTLQRWSIENLTLLHLGALNRLLTDTELQELEKTAVDVLFLPIDGGDALTTEQALSLVTTIEPRVVIPIKYSNIHDFAKEMGIDPGKSEKKCAIKANKLPQDELQTIVLSPS